MKAKVTKKDGTVIELEGSAEEIARIVDPPILPAAPPSPAVVLQPQSDLAKWLEEMQKAADKQALPHQPWTIPNIYPKITFYEDACPMGGNHEYPQLWMSVSPPACSKCHKQGAPTTTTITCQNTTGGVLTGDTTLPPGGQIPFISAFTIVGSEIQS